MPDPTPLMGSEINHRDCSEEAPPYDKESGINTWLPVKVQWVLTFASIGSFYFWGFAGESIEMLEKGIPAIYFLFGLPVFYGLVSDAATTSLIVHVVGYGLGGVFAYFGALLPYVIGWFVLNLASVHVFSAIKKNLVKYDMATTSFAGPTAYGAFNALGYLLARKFDLSEHYRWFITVTILSTTTGGLMIIKKLLGQEVTSYKLNLAQLVRYYGFCLALYTFQFAFVAKYTEQLITSEVST